MDLKFCLFLKFKTSIPTWSCNSDSKFPFQLSIKTQIQNIVSKLLLWFNPKASFSSCYYNTNLKLCFWFLVRIQTGSFAFELKFEFSSNEKMKQRWNINPNFFFKFNLKLCFWLFVRIRTRIFFSYFSFE